MVFFSKDFRYSKSKISPKLHRLLFLFFFLAFSTPFFLFHLSKLVKKLWRFLQCFIGRIRDFINKFYKFLKVLLKKYRYLNFFFKIPQFLYVFIFLFFIFSFQFRLSVLVKKFLKFLCSFILWIRDFIKEFQKIMEYFLKKY